MKAQLFEMGEEDLTQFCKNSKSSLILTILSWIEMGKKMGFDPFTARLVPDKGPQFFYAEPIKEDDQRG